LIKIGRKGRVSNELVAASCAAILSVYAAGSWRTRDAAQRPASDDQARRPMRPALSVPAPSASASAAVVEAATSASSPSPSAPPGAIESEPRVTKLPKTDVRTASVPAALPQPSEPASSAVAVVAVDQSEEPAAEVAAAEVQAEAPAPDHKPWLDGYYTGWGTSRHGDIQAFVNIEEGKITNAGIATCETRYPCSVINHILLQPVELQGPDVDRVSRATESGDAYYYGLVAALENAETGTFKSKRP
jgi:uncharacterized protein with FMN-binding domain